MNSLSENLTVISPKNQLHLFGYEHYFNSFIKLYQKNKLPNVILLSGPNGSGKATFAYHFINYLLSYNEENKYSVNDLPSIQKIKVTNTYVTIHIQIFHYLKMVNLVKILR